MDVRHVLAAVLCVGPHPAPPVVASLDLGPAMFVQADVGGISRGRNPAMSW